MSDQDGDGEEASHNANEQGSARHDLQVEGISLLDLLSDGHLLLRHDAAFSVFDVLDVGHYRAEKDVSLLLLLRGL